IVERQAEVDQLELKLAALASDVSNEEDALAAKSSSLTAEIDSLEATLSEKQDAIATAETELSRLEGEIATAQELLLTKEGEVEEQQVLLNAQTTELQTAEASLAAIKADQADVEAETVELKSAIDRQQAALDDLDILKGKLDETGEALARQTALLSERQSELAAADTQLDEIRQAAASDPSAGQSLPTIPIAELSKDSLAVLPIDPLYVPFPIQTPKGVRLTQIHFDFASADLTPGGLRKAKEAAAWIKAQDVEKVRLVGFTDSIGTKANNKALAERRARSLLQILEDEGVDGSRIEIVANGEEGVQELVPDQTAEPLNRCVGIFISTQG
ncbi:MAG: OmpA family protein, partial [Geminicoccaceae bacterium]